MYTTAHQSSASIALYLFFIYCSFFIAPHSLSFCPSIIFLFDGFSSIWRIFDLILISAFQNLNHLYSVLPRSANCCVDRMSLFTPGISWWDWTLLHCLHIILWTSQVHLHLFIDCVVGGHPHHCKEVLPDAMVQEGGSQFAKCQKLSRTPFSFLFLMDFGPCNHPW